MADISAVRANAAQRQIVRDLLIIDDVTGYTAADGTTFITGYDPYSFAANLFNISGEKISPAVERVLTGRKPDLNKVRTEIWKKLPDDKQLLYTRDLQPLLDRSETRRDLMQAIAAIPTDGSISPQERQYFIDLLVVDDLSGWTDKENLFILGYDPARFVSHALDTDSIGVSQETEDLLTKPSPDVNNIKEGLLARLDSNGRAVYLELQATLTQPEDQKDLLAALCALEGGSICPAISGPSPASAKQGETVEIKVSTTMLLESPALIFFDSENKQETSIAATYKKTNPDGSIVFDVIIPKTISPQIFTLKVADGKYPLLSGISSGNFTVESATPLPSISSVYPVSIPADAENVTFVIEGTSLPIDANVTSSDATIDGIRTRTDRSGITFKLVELTDRTPGTRHIIITSPNNPALRLSGSVEITAPEHVNHQSLGISNSFLQNKYGDINLFSAYYEPISAERTGTGLSLPLSFQMRGSGDEYRLTADLDYSWKYLSIQAGIGALITPRSEGSANDVPVDQNIITIDSGDNAAEEESGSGASSERKTTREGAKYSAGMIRAGLSVILPISERLLLRLPMSFNVMTAFSSTKEDRQLSKLFGGIEFNPNFDITLYRGDSVSHDLSLGGTINTRWPFGDMLVKEYGLSAGYHLSW